MNVLRAYRLASYHLIMSHYNDVTVSAVASQITSLPIVYSTVYSRRRSKKTSKLRVTGLCEGNSPLTGEFPHKGPVTRKMFLFDDVIMCILFIETRCHTSCMRQRTGSASVQVMTCYLLGAKALPKTNADAMSIHTQEEICGELIQIIIKSIQEMHLSRNVVFKLSDMLKSQCVNKLRPYTIMAIRLFLRVQFSISQRWCQHYGLVTIFPWCSIAVPGKFPWCTLERVLNEIVYQHILAKV